MYEETGLHLSGLTIFGLYSGEKCYVEYPNQDQVYSVQVIFKASVTEGDLIQEGPECKEHRYFHSYELPGNLNPRQATFIQDWAAGKMTPILD